MDLLTQCFIREHGLSSLTDRFAIIAKRHGEFPNLVFLKYNQIESPMAEPVVQECRGLILDEADDWRVVSFPFRKFFNYGEGHAAAIDWQTASVYEKLDGSLMTLYWYRGEWRVASNGLPDASGSVYGHDGTFADLFWETWNHMGLELPPAQCRAECFMFELMTPHNRVVVPHTESKLVCIGGRNLATLAERNAIYLGGVFDWPLVRSLPIRTVADCVAAAEAINPMESEGFVVCDGNFNRVKVKSPQYVALAHMKDQFSARRMLEVVRLNESDEFLTYFPEMRPLYDDVRGQFESLCSEVESDYSRLQSIAAQKDFALQAVKTRCSSALFAMRAGKVASVREFFASLPMQTMERFVKIAPDQTLAA